MKVLVRLSIVVASLLLVNNMAFAQTTSCDQQLCYDIYATKTDGSVEHEGFWYFCLYNNGTGQLRDDDSAMNLYLFGGGPGWFNSSGTPGYSNGNPKWSSWIVSGKDVSGYLQPIGEGGGPEGGLLNGILYDEGDRDVINGIKVPLSKCPD
jgi:hypothetical protein